jgi:hypothetical protein
MITRMKIKIIGGSYPIAKKKFQFRIKSIHQLLRESAWPSW